MEMKEYMENKESVNNNEYMKTNSSNTRKPYESLSMTVVETASALPILAASIVNNSMIQSVGQELGPSYDLSSEGGIDSNTGKTFSHEWETEELL